VERGCTVGKLGPTEVVMANRRLVIQCVLDAGHPSRTEIAEQSGLSTATVTRVVAYLMTVGILAEDTALVATEGRSRIPIIINPSYGIVALIEFECYGLVVHLFDFSLKETASVPLAYAETAEKTLKRICHVLPDPTSFGRELRGIGVVWCDGAPGADDREARAHLLRQLKERYGVPVCERDEQECAEAEILSRQAETVRDNHLLMAFGSRVRVSIAQKGQTVNLRGGSSADLTETLGPAAGPSFADTLSELLSFLMQLFTIEAIFFMFTGFSSSRTGRFEAVREAMAGFRKKGSASVPVIYFEQSSEGRRAIVSAEVRESVLLKAAA
jgi:hypothetical protein